MPLPLLKFFRGNLGRKIALSYLALFIAVFAASEWYLSRVLEERALANLKDSLTVDARILSLLFPASLIQAGDREKIQATVSDLGAASGIRITLIDSQGVVLGDSDRTMEELLAMENHRKRPEIRSALGGQVGAMTRFSTTINARMLFMAFPLKEGDVTAGVMRLSVPLTSIEKIMASIDRPIWISFMLGSFLILLLGIGISRSATKPVRAMTRAALLYSKGDLSGKIPVESEDELSILARAMNQMAASLKERISEIEKEKIKLSTILDNMTEAVIAVESDRRILAINPGAEKIFGVPKPAAMGRLLIETIRNQKIDEIMAKAINDQTLVPGELESRQPGGKTLRINAVGIGKSESGVCGFLVANDVTEVRRLENLRREFVANVSHELKTPLTSIKGFIETLLGGALEDRVQSERFLKIMDEDAERLTRLIDEILDLSQIESADASLRPEPVELQRELSKVLSVFEARIHSKKLRIENRLTARPLPPVLADRDQLKQVFMNLLDNAIKFSGENGRIIIDAASAEGEKLRVSIEDTGIGIPEHLIPRIFERFFRVDKARSRELGGTGLGLAIVKHIIEAHGGDVTCESRAGKGSKFSFTLRIPTPPLS